MPLWKWMIEILIGIVAFFTLYGFGECIFLIPSYSLRIFTFFISSALILSLFVVWLRLLEQRWSFELLTNRIRGNISKGVLIGFMFFCLLISALALTGNYHGEYASPHWKTILMNLSFYLLVACSEEVIFRGIMFRMIDERFGTWWGIGISAILFGFAHIIQDNATIWSAFAIAIEGGVLLGAAFKYSGSLMFPIGIHWAWNFSEGNIFGLPVSGGEIEESVFRSTTNGAAILTGGSFGPEASIFAIILGATISYFLLRAVAKKVPQLKKSVPPFHRQKTEGRSRITCCTSVPDEDDRGEEVTESAFL